MIRSFFLSLVIAFLGFSLAACGNFATLSPDTPTELAEEETPTPVFETADSYEEDPNCLTSEEALLAYEPVNADVWARIRDGFALDHPENARVEQELKWYAKHPGYMERVAIRGEPYLFHIVEAVEKRGLPMELALLPIVESAFDPFAYSPGRASGIWQFVPWTGRSLGLKQNWWYDGRRDIVASTEAALTYLERQYKRFDGDWLLALASYNSGAGNVNKAIRKNERLGRPTDFWNLQLPRETKAYVPRLLALSKLVAQPENYDLELYSVANEPWFAAVAVGSQIDLAQAAELAEIDMELLYRLNPGFNRWATDPKGPHELLVPIDKAAAFEEKLAAIPESDRVTWERYTIKSGDTLSTIARRYKVSVSSLKGINQLKSNNIRAGKTLMVPQAAANAEHYTHSSLQRLIRKQDAGGKGKSNVSRVNYVVQKGDSFWTISRRFRVRTNSIAKWNNMAPTDTLSVGQKLTIWTESPEMASVDNPAVIRKLNYKVRKGDSLARIADKFGVNVNDIIKWNGVNPGKYLQPGDKLTLFVDVKAI